MTDKDKDQFDKWVDMWDKVSAEFAAESAESKQQAKAKAVSTHSYFGMQSVTPDEEPSDAKMLTESDHFREIYYRSLKVNKMLNEEEENADFQTSGPGKTKFTQNPVHFASHGQDQSPSPNEPVRVTPNFTDGPQLQELNDLKIKLEKLESTLLAADIKGEGKSDYKSQLDQLRKKIDKLSDSLVLPPIEDVT